ncbi:MAG: hypothetical protein CUN52_09680 [Phototrophicales bacterium]|nr:MAG: hypothetical protein CUN52_09680 [Phototrophicales bacterium]
MTIIFKSKAMLFASLFIVLLVMTACGGGGSADEVVVGVGADTPEEAVQGFLEAAFSGDRTRAATFVCNAQRELMRGMYADMNAAFTALEEFEVDLSELNYTIVSEEATDATVAVIGDIVIRVAGSEEERRINLDERFKAVKLKKEDELWRVC